MDSTAFFCGAVASAVLTLLAAWLAGATFKSPPSTQSTASDKTSSVPAEHSVTDIAQLRSLIASERQGRITAEKRMRALLQSVSAARHNGQSPSTAFDHSSSSGAPASSSEAAASSALINAPGLDASAAAVLTKARPGTAHTMFPRTGGGSWVPIAHLESPFLQRNGTPRQGGLVPSVRARIHMDKRTAPRDSTFGLTEYSHVWLVWEFHENTNVVGTLKAKIVPPRAGGAKVGIYSTRTPHRHNPIGLSLVELVSVSADGSIITVAGADLLDGTPIYDIKPYIPFFESRPTARVPAWVAGDAPLSSTTSSPDAPHLPGAGWAGATVWDPVAEREFAALCSAGAAEADAAPAHGRGKRAGASAAAAAAAKRAWPCRFYSPEPEDAEALRQTLTELCEMQDFRAQHRKQAGAGEHSVVFDGIKVDIRVEEDPAAAGAGAGASSGIATPARNSSNKAKTAAAVSTGRREGAVTRSRSRAPPLASATAAAADDDDDGDAAAPSKSKGESQSESKGESKAHAPPALRVRITHITAVHAQQQKEQQQLKKQQQQQQQQQQHAAQASEEAAD